MANRKQRPKTEGRAEVARAAAPQKQKPFSIRDFLKSLGPGLITGASDDDPSGIGTYSQAGAQLGYGIGWTMLLTFPLMAAIQEISARVGRVTGHGISGNVCRHYPRWLLVIVVALLFIANTINIAADLGAMADATKLLIGGHGIVYVVLFGVISVAAQIFLDYKRYVAVLKWLTLSLFAYVAALAFAKVSWGEALSGVLIPKITWNADYFTTIVAILGTTISPYLFFWQASQEAEDQRIDTSKHPLIEKHFGARREFSRIRADTIVGMAFSNLIALAIITTAAATLHASGKTDIESSAQAAEALRPIADRWRSGSLRSASSAPDCWRSRCWRAPPPMRSARAGSGRWVWRASRKRRWRSMPCWRCRARSASRSTSPRSIRSRHCTGARSSTACSPFPSWCC